MVEPIMTRAATLARGIPFALEMNGTVRLPLGFASSTNTSSPFTANWMLIRPLTSRATANSLVAPRISFIASPEMVGGGVTQLESPE